MWWIALTLFLMAGCVGGARPDDALEPNDDLPQATVLTLGQPVEGRANQGDPDMFSIELPAGGTLVFHLEHRGLENCPSFAVTGPDGQLLHDDGRFPCANRPPPQVRAPGVELEFIGGHAKDYALRVPVGQAGRYVLSIHEQGATDNHAPFSWDYRLTAHLE
jgi:hypothetical protein